MELLNTALSWLLGFHRLYVLKFLNTNAVVAMYLGGGGNEFEDVRKEAIIFWRLSSAWHSFLSYLTYSIMVDSSAAVRASDSTCIQMFESLLKLRARFINWRAPNTFKFRTHIKEHFGAKRFLPFRFIFCHALQFLLIRIRIGNDHQFSSKRSATADTTCPRFQFRVILRWGTWSFLRLWCLFLSFVLTLVRQC